MSSWIKAITVTVASLTFNTNGGLEIQDGYALCTIASRNTFVVWQRGGNSVMHHSRERDLALVRQTTRASHERNKGEADID